MNITPVGDSALRIELGPTVDETTVGRVASATSALMAARLTGVVELVPAYRTVTVYYDPAALAAEGAPADDLAGWLEDLIRRELESDLPATIGAGPIIEIPVCYGGEFGPDLDTVAAHTGLSTAEVVRRHAEPTYAVAMIGFAPGFPYLMGLPKELATPRHDTPRLRVPAGSIGIGGGQTGIYPLPTPGGWNLIGRTPRRLFRPEHTRPTLLRAGDRVTFRSIPPEAFANWHESEEAPGGAP